MSLKLKPFLFLSKTKFLLILSTLFYFLIFLVPQAHSQEITNVNVLFFYEDDELLKVLDSVDQYLRKNPPKKVLIGKKVSIKVEGTDALKVVSELCQKVDAIATTDKPDLVIDFTRHGIPSEAVKVIVKSLNLPTISATFGQEGDIREWRDLTETQKKYLIQVSPPADVLVQSVRSIVDSQNMTSAVVLFNSDYEMYHKYKSLLQNMPTRHLLTKLKTSVKDIRSQVDRLVHVDIVNFFIAASPEEISEVLAQASDPAAPDGPYFSDEYAWYSMSLEESSIPHCKGCQMDISLVHLSPEASKSDDVRRAFFQSMGLPSKLTEMFYFDMAINAILAMKELKDSTDWKPLVIPSCSNFDEKKPQEEFKLDLFEAFQKVGKTENIFGPFTLSENGKNFPYFKMKIQRLLFKKGNEKPYSTETVGFWEAGFEEQRLITYESGRDLSAHLAHTVFRIVTVVQPPFVYWIDGCYMNTTDKYHHCFEGYCIDLLTEIQKELKFNFTIRNVSDYGYMSAEPPHNWNGMVAELKNRKADIALGAMSVMAERESVVDFTVPYYDLVGISILMRKPKATTSLFKFLTVLENDVWMCILGAYFFTSILMWIFDRWSPYSYQNNREKYEDDEEKREFNLKECLWFCMTSLTPQGGGEAPKNLSGRLVAATWWLFGFIIIASYTANLAAFLTVSRLDAPVESLEDLSKQYKIQYAPVKESSAWIYFDRMAHIEHRFYEIWKDMSLNDSLTDYERSQLAVWDYPVSDKFTKMWQAMQENAPPDSFQLAIDRVRGDESKETIIDGFAFLGEATDIKYQTITACVFNQVGEEFSRKPYAIAVQKGSPLKESFSHMILKLLNQRHLEQLKEQWWNDNPYKAKCPKDDNQSDGISIHNIGGVFIVIFVGIIMACFTLLFEYWWYKKRNVSEDMGDMALPPSKDFGTTFTTEKTNFNTQYNKPHQHQKASDLPSIENSW